MRKALIILFLLSFTIVGLAQDDVLMNWCDEGGPMEGSCTIPGDEALTNYLWELGWYLAAVDRYEIALSDVPDRYIKHDTGNENTGSNDKSDGGSSANCNSITLPNAPDGAATVTGELVYGGVTYASESIDAGVYNTYAAGQTYDPSIIGDKHKVKITSKDGDGKKIKSKTYKFKCTGDFDETAGGILGP